MVTAEELAPFLDATSAEFRSAVDSNGVAYMPIIDPDDPDYDEKIKEKAYIITSWQVQETIQKTRVASTKSFIMTGKLFPSR